MYGEPAQKHFVFKMYFCDGTRFSRTPSRSFMPGLAAGQRRHCLHLTSFGEILEDIRIAARHIPRIRSTDEADRALTRSIMEKHGVKQVLDNGGVFWAHDDKDVQSYLLIPAETHQEANQRMRTFLDELTHEQIARSIGRPLFHILPAFEWTGSNYPPYDLQRCEVVRSL